METTKPYSRRKNTYFKNIGFIKNYFLSVCYTNTNLQKSFLWENSTSEIKHDTLCNDYKDGGLKNVDIRKCLQCSWIKRYMMIRLMNGKL